MPGTRIVYVTRTGHARALAEEVAKLVGGQAAEIGDRVQRRGLWGFLKSGSQASRGAATPIDDPGVELSGAEAIVLVQPVWASSVCPPLRSWLRAHRGELAGKRIGLLVTNKGSEGDPLRAKFEREFGGLASFAVVPESMGPAERAGALADFVRALA